MRVTFLSGLYPWPRRIIITGLVVLAAVVGGSAVYGVLRSHARAEAAALQQKLCESELRALRLANPLLRSFSAPRDPCAALRVVGP